jgi:hypothetical protein
MKNAKQWNTLGLVGAIWIGILGYQLVMRDDTQHIPLQNTSTPLSKSTAPIESDDLTIHSLPRKKSSAGAMPRHNPFTALKGTRTAPEGTVLKTGMGRKVKPTLTPSDMASSLPLPPPPQAEALPMPPSPEEVAAKALIQERELVAKQLRERMEQFRILGYAQRAGSSQAFLAKGSDIYVVQQGDLLDGKFIVSLINGQGVTIQEPSFHMERIIEIKGDGKGPS